MTHTLSKGVLRSRSLHTVVNIAPYQRQHIEIPHRQHQFSPFNPPSPIIIPFFIFRRIINTMASANRTSVASVKYESVDDTMAVKFIMNGTEDPNSKIKTHVDIYMAIERIYQDTIEAHGHKGYNPDWWRWKIEKSVWEKNCKKY